MSGRRLTVLCAHAHPYLASRPRSTLCSCAPTLSPPAHPLCPPPCTSGGSEGQFCQCRHHVQLVCRVSGVVRGPPQLTTPLRYLGMPSLHAPWGTCGVTPCGVTEAFQCSWVSVLRVGLNRPTPIPLALPPPPPHPTPLAPAVFAACPSPSSLGATCCRLGLSLSWTSLIWTPRMMPRSSSSGRARS